MNGGADAPDVARLRAKRKLGGQPVRRAGSITLRNQRREAEISKHDVRDRIIARKVAAEEHVVRLDVAMDDSAPAFRWDVRISLVATIAKVKKGNGFRQLDEAVPDETFGSALFISSRYIIVQIAPLAEFEIQNQSIVSLQIIRAVELDDSRVVLQYFFENVHLAWHVTEHFVDILFLAYQNFPVAFPLDDDDLALAARPELFHLFVGFFGLLGMGSTIMSGTAFFLFEFNYGNKHRVWVCVRAVGCIC